MHAGADERVESARGQIEPRRPGLVYTPAAAGGYVEELLKSPAGPINDERNKLRERHRWEVVGPNPL